MAYTGDVERDGEWEDVQENKGSSIRKGEGSHYSDQGKGLEVNDNLQCETKGVVKHERDSPAFS